MIVRSIHSQVNFDKRAKVISREKTAFSTTGAEQLDIPIIESSLGF